MSSRVDDWYVVSNGSRYAPCMALYKHLLAWKECHQLVLDVYKATEKWPKYELYGLTSQTRRAAFSGAANIVEGATRKGRNEFKRFLSISLASLAEVEYALDVATALGYLESAVVEALAIQQRRARSMTWKLQRSLG
jgi:four helix bundle protein